jgi:hypothetical protein
MEMRCIYLLLETTCDAASTTKLQTSFDLFAIQPYDLYSNLTILTCWLQTSFLRLGEGVALYKGATEMTLRPPTPQTEFLPSGHDKFFCILRYGLMGEMFTLLATSVQRSRVDERLTDKQRDIIFVTNTYTR